MFYGYNAKLDAPSCYGLLWHVLVLYATITIMSWLSQHATITISYVLTITASLQHCDASICWCIAAGLILPSVGLHVPLFILSWRKLFRPKTTNVIHPTVKCCSAKLVQCISYTQNVSHQIGINNTCATDKSMHMHLWMDYKRPHHKIVPCKYSNLTAHRKGLRRVWLHCCGGGVRSTFVLHVLCSHWLPLLT